MNPLIAQHLDAIRALASEYGVRRLELFGSAATDAFAPGTSDVDFLAEYPPDYPFGPWLTRYFEFQEALSALLGRPVDLVMEDAPRNPHVVRSIAATRRLLYAA